MTIKLSDIYGGGSGGGGGGGGGGIPAGGMANQVLEKVDGTDGNVQWATLPSGGGGGVATLPFLHVTFELPSGTSIPAINSPDHRIELNTKKIYAIPGSLFMPSADGNLNAGKIMLRAGTYYIDADIFDHADTSGVLQIQMLDGAGTVLASKNGYSHANACVINGRIAGKFTFTAGITNLEFKGKSAAGHPRKSHGAASVAGVPEVYSSVRIWKLA